MGRVFKPLVYWARTEKGRGHPQRFRLQLDTAADRTVLPKLPPGAEVSGRGKINGRPVYLVEIAAFIPETSCTAVLKAAVPVKKGSVPSVIGADFFQESRSVIDYRGHLIGCPGGRSHTKGFAGFEKTGVMREAKKRR